MHIILNYVATVHFPLNSATTKQSPAVYWRKVGFTEKYVRKSLTVLV